jgi:hypothetical protein
MFFCTLTGGRHHGGRFHREDRDEPPTTETLNEGSRHRRQQRRKAAKFNKAVDTTAANARPFHNETTKSTNSDKEALTEAAVASP